MGSARLLGPALGEHWEMGQQIMTLLQAASIASLAIAGGVCFYHALLAIVAISTKRANGRHTGGSLHRFAIVLPAHNEEPTLKHALDACDALEYPEDKYAVYVIADNCSDRTADIAEAGGAVCLVRHDTVNRGKGQALEWALPQVLADGWDAVVVLDADCRMDRHALRVFDRHMTAGSRVLQANDAVSNPDDSGISYLLAVANTLENDLFYAPKSRLGWAVFLRGTGMVFHRDVLQSHPWQASSIVEDAEYTCRLLREGIPVRFVPDVRVVSDFPVDREQLTVQRTRWVGGGLVLAGVQSVRLFWEGMIERRPLLLDAGVTTCIVSRPLIIAQLLVTCTLALLCCWLQPDGLSYSILASFAAIAVAYALYVIAGAWLLGLNRQRMGLLFQAPAVVIRYLLLSARSLLAGPNKVWERTPRQTTPSTLPSSTDVATGNESS